MFVGGVVRDCLLGIRSEDFDVSTTLDPEALADVFPNLDRRFGVVHEELTGGVLTISSLRRDGEYLDRRHPSTVTFVSSPEEDAPRRDFTINALYADPWSGEITDPCGGRRDLATRTLRVIGDAHARLCEDPLRLLRAVRFAARMNLEPTPETDAAIRSLAGELSVVSRERVFQELTMAFVGPGRGRALQLLVEWGLAEHVLPEVVALQGVEQPPEFHPEGDVFVHVCSVLEHVVPGDEVQAWAAVLHDLGKPATFERAADRIRFSGHDTLSAKMADGVLRRLKAPNELRETVVEVCRDHIKFAGIEQMKPVRRERWMRSPRFVAHLEFHRADCEGSHRKLDIYHRARETFHSLPPEPPPPLCTGADVIQRGVAEGPLVGEILRRLHRELEDLGVSTRESALEHLDGLVQESFRGDE